jgi:hypothetical protein
VPPFKRRGELILYYNFLLLVEEEYPEGGRWCGFIFRN